ncbi:MAG: hypothetical protein J0H78_10850 [Rhizobiales bacterium]|nr:hypothetical protein [Hyphomicrobiales bacterium]
MKKPRPETFSRDEVTERFTRLVATALKTPPARMTVDKTVKKKPRRGKQTTDAP